MINKSVKKFSFFFFRQNDTGLRSTESGYTSTPCNNALLQQNQTNPVAPPPPGSAPVPGSGGSDEKGKNSNLLVNVPTKDDVGEKNNITGVSTNVVVNNGTIGRNGTLCKKVYL